MRTTLLATLSALALLSAPALAGGTSSQAAGGGGTSTGAAGQSDTGSTMQSGGAGGSTTGATGTTGTTGTTGAAGTTGGASGSQTAVSEDQIRSMLEAEGYTDVSNLQQQGDMYQAQAMKGGEQVTVMIDPSTGEIRPQQQ